MKVEDLWQWYEWIMWGFIFDVKKFRWQLSEMDFSIAKTSRWITASIFNLKGVMAFHIDHQG